METFYVKYMKRVLDIIISGTMIILFSPVLLILAVIVKVNLGSPIIFKQLRPGKEEHFWPDSASNRNAV